MTSCPSRSDPTCPDIRAWTEQHYDFCGYITGFDPADFADRDALRAELGYRPDEFVCIVTVGGSGVGGALLRRIVQAYPAVKAQHPRFRMIVVAGPRIDPAALDVPPGVEVHGYVHGLHRHLAACDLAVVQGGLTSTMELAASGRPFLYFPLANHFEQPFHVRHRLERYGAGRALDFRTTDPESLAAAMSQELADPRLCGPVETDGADRAADLLASLVDQ